MHLTVFRVSFFDDFVANSARKFFLPPSKRRLAKFCFFIGIHQFQLLRISGYTLINILPMMYMLLKTVSGCMNQLVQLGRIKHLLDKKTLLLLINSFVFSKLFYCSSVWGNTSKRNLQKLQLVQNFAARVVLGLRKYDHISQGRRSLK